MNSWFSCLYFPLPTKCWDFCDHHHFLRGNNFKIHYLFTLVVLGITQGASHVQGKHSTSRAVAQGYTYTFTYCEFGYPRPMGIAVSSFWFSLRHLPYLISADGKSILQSHQKLEYNITRVLERISLCSFNLCYNTVSRLFLLSVIVNLILCLIEN